MFYEYYVSCVIWVCLKHAECRSLLNVRIFSTTPHTYGPSPAFATIGLAVPC